MLSLLFLPAVLEGCNSSKHHRTEKVTSKMAVEYPLTVAAMNPAFGEDAYIEVTFNESARFYKIPKNAAPEYLRLLKKSKEEQIPVLVKRASESSDMILTVRKK